MNTDLTYRLSGGRRRPHRPKAPLLSDPELAIPNFRQDSVVFIQAKQVLSTQRGPEAIQIRLEMLVQYSKCKTQRLLNQHFEKLIKCQVSF